MPVGPDGYRLPTINVVANTNKIECLPGDQDDFNRTFVIYDEDHTLGNPLKHIILQYPEVTFCGYAIPHPMERKMNFRIQCVGKPSTELLRQGLKDLKKLNEDVLDMLKNEVQKHSS